MKQLQGSELSALQISLLQKEEKLQVKIHIKFDHITIAGNLCGKNMHFYPKKFLVLSFMGLITAYTN